MLRIDLSAVLLLISFLAQAQPFQLPTANRALFEKGGEDRFFVPTTGKTWVSGTCGCVRSNGRQMHEGLDIRCLERDRHGEPADPVMATADGVVVYINNRPSLSNYGRYIVVRHNIQGVEIYSLYAHLSEVVPGIKTGVEVKGGQVIAIMGRTSNTGERITKERAHVHFELNLFYNDHFAVWFKKHNPGERNDHGNFNGQNLVGIDPRLVLLESHAQGAHFNLVSWLQHRPELCRVLVRKTDFSWLRRYPMLVAPAQGIKGPIGGYQISLDYNGLPFALQPVPASAIRSAARYQLLAVDEAEETKNPCRKLVSKRSGRWQLASNGINLLDLITY